MGPFTQAVLVLAAARVATALALAVARWSDIIHPGDPVPPIVYVVETAAFAGSACWLWVAGRGDVRARYLAGFFIVTASAFSTPLLRVTLSVIPGGDRWLPFVETVHADAFLPALLWLFVREFPDARSFDRMMALPNVMLRIGWPIGIALFLLNAVSPILAGTPPGRTVSAFERNDPSGLYWLALFALALPALPFVVWKTRRARIRERHRVGLLVLGLVVGFGPLLLAVIVEQMVPPVHRLMEQRAMRQAGALILYPLLLSIPLTTTYAVTVERVLDVRIILRQAVRYSLERYTIAFASLVPFASFGWTLYAHRHESIQSIVTGSRAILTLGVLAAGIALLAGRRRLLIMIDRRFFRDEFDAQTTLTALVARIGAAPTVAACAELIAANLERALHVRSAAVLVARDDELVAPAHVVRALPLSSPIVAGLRRDGEPVAADLTDWRSPIRILPADDRQWLAETGFHLLVPIVSTEHGLIGIIGLGEKKSELPFRAEDTALLASVASACALALDNLRMREQPQARDAHADEPAAVCTACDAVANVHARACPQCNAAIVPVRVPRVVAGKFVVQRKLGAGGMGVVYLGNDLALHRPVAIKTLPEMSPEQAARLQAEARAMAAFVHPNLATIFGSETWRGSQLLVMEYFGGGTLYDRLKRRLLTVEEMAGLGVAIGDALQTLHGGGVVHRDIKPSNIGFTTTDVPKLLDFGLAHMVSQTTSSRSFQTAMTDDADDTRAVVKSARLTSHGVVVGTPRYMSPEALNGGPPAPSFDLWSLAVVLYETVAGEHPFRSRDAGGAVEAVLQTKPTDIREYDPACPAPVADFFTQCLASRPRQRPATARQMKDRLLALVRATQAA
jgi:serine/threonine-protein kinase